MVGLGRWWGVTALLAIAISLSAAPSFSTAGAAPAASAAPTASAAVAEPPEPPGKCFRSDAEGNLPTCAYVDGEWQVSYDSAVGGFGVPGADDDFGIPGWFVAVAVLMALGGTAVFVWRIWLARRMASEAGMSPDRATAVTLLDDSGLGATYVASTLKPRRRTGRTGRTRPTHAPAAAPTPSAEDRLRQLAELKADGLVTDDEYHARRKAIIDSL